MARAEAAARTPATIGVARTVVLATTVASPADGSGYGPGGYSR
ncbi:MAG: hypothetical protein V2A58_06435 [Planctomycetota bacterium]